MAEIFGARQVTLHLPTHPTHPTCAHSLPNNNRGLTTDRYSVQHSTTLTLGTASVNVAWYAWSHWRHSPDVTLHAAKTAKC